MFNPRHIGKNLICLQRPFKNMTLSLVTHVDKSSVRGSFCFPAQLTSVSLQQGSHRLTLPSWRTAAHFPVLSPLSCCSVFLLGKGRCLFSACPQGTQSTVSRLSEMSCNEALHHSHECSLHIRHTFAAQTTASQGAGCVPGGWTCHSPTAMLPHSSEPLTSQEHLSGGRPL